MQYDVPTPGNMYNRIATICPCFGSNFPIHIPRSRYRPLLGAIVLCGIMVLLMPGVFALKGKRTPRQCPACVADKMSPRKRWHLQVSALVVCLLMVVIVSWWYVSSFSCCGSCPIDQWEEAPWIVTASGDGVAVESSAQWQDDGSLRVEHCTSDLPLELSIPDCGADGRRRLDRADNNVTLDGDSLANHQRPNQVLSNHTSRRSMQECNGQWVAGGGACICTADTNDGNAGTSSQTCKSASNHHYNLIPGRSLTDCLRFQIR